MDSMTCLKELKKLPEIIDVPVIILTHSMKKILKIHKNLVHQII